MDDEREAIVPGGPNDPSVHEEDPASFFGSGAGEPEAEEEKPSVLTKEKGADDEGAAGEPEPTIEPAVEPTPEPEPAPAVSEGKKSGTVSRDYKIFVERRLSQAVLERLLKMVKDGSDGDVPIAYFELGTITARNPAEALKKGFKQHRGELGEEATLAAPSANAFQPKAVRPRPPQPDDEQIQVG